MESYCRNIVGFLYLYCVLFELVSTTPTWYTASAGNEYLIEEEYKYNWLQANDQCARQGLQLAVIDNSDKNAALVRLLRNIFESSQNLWFAHHDEFNSIKDTNRPFYSMVTGKQISFQNWKNGEPNNHNSQEHCVHIFQSSDFQWNDYFCDATNNGYICERHYATVEYSKDMEEKQRLANEKNSALISSFENKRNKIQDVLQDSRNATGSILVEFKNSTNAIVIEAKKSFEEVIRRKPYMEAVMADLGDTIKDIIAQASNEIAKVSDEAWQTIEEMLLYAEIMTSDIHSEFAEELNTNKNAIDKLLVN